MAWGIRAADAAATTLSEPSETREGNNLLSWQLLLFMAVLFSCLIGILYFGKFVDRLLWGPRATLKKKKKKRENSKDPKRTKRGKDPAFVVNNERLHRQSLVSSLSFPLSKIHEHGGSVATVDKSPVSGCARPCSTSMWQVFPCDESRCLPAHGALGGGGSDDDCNGRQRGRQRGG